MVPPPEEAKHDLTLCDVVNGITYVGIEKPSEHPSEIRLGSYFMIPTSDLVRRSSSYESYLKEAGREFLVRNDEGYENANIVSGNVEWMEGFRISHGESTPKRLGAHSISLRLEHIIFKTKLEVTKLGVPREVGFKVEVVNPKQI